jgi:hypothetical protein
MSAASGLIVIPGEWSGTILQSAYECPNCHRLNIAFENGDDYVDQPRLHPRDEAQTHKWSPYVSWLPKRGQSRDFPDVPPHIAAAATEATLCLSMGAYRAVGSLARAVVEATAKDKNASGQNLAVRINALAAAGHIREHTKEQAHEIRYFGNDMAHGDFADPLTKEEAVEIVELMSELLNEVYQSPARLDRVRDARKAKKAP